MDDPHQLHQLHQLLRNHIIEICHELLPGGRVISQEYRASNINGGQGKGKNGGSLAVCLTDKPGTLRKWRWEGKGPKFFKIGSSVRYSIEDLQNYIAKARRQNTSEIFTGKEANNG